MEIQLERTQLTGRPMANEVGKKKIGKVKDDKLLSQCCH